jgi:two-component system phosphate regulon response regulator PhoB
MVRLNLTDLYEVFDTGQPEEALALALEHKPDAILLDPRMPGYSGFELCKTLTSLSATQLIPVFVISGEGGAKTKDFCRIWEQRRILRSRWTLKRCAIH